MAFRWLKRYLPRSLYLRAALILVLPVIVLQTVLSVVFVQRLFEDVTQQMTGNLGVELSYLTDLVEAAPDRATAQAWLAATADELRIEWSLPDPDPVTESRRTRWDLSGRMVIPTLERALVGLGGVDLVSDEGVVDLTVATSKGPLGLSFDRDRVSAENPHQLLVITFLTAMLMTGVAYLFLRNQLKPIKRMAEAAAAFGRGRSVPYRPSGAAEVREAGAAFLDMRHRIERQIEQRTTMLSGISHDLRTPLTRLNLGLAMIDDPEVEPMRADVDEMRRMLDAFLDFARDGALDEPAPSDPEAIVRDAAEKARRGGAAVEMGEIARVGLVPLRPLAVARAVENLVSNALRHGERCRVSLAAIDTAVIFTVEDDGPGIPEPQREDAMRAFTRLDLARNQDRGGGVGLGLAIARDVARQHGGTLRLGRSERLGGLRADLVLAR